MMLFLLLLLSFLSALFFTFLFSDGDFTLMSKRHVKREEIRDKVVWITGASRGIGEVLAKQLAELGAKVILSARNEAELERVKKQLRGKYAPDEVKILPLDLASGEDSLREAVEKAESYAGAGVDYMIHNAAYERPKTTALDVTEESHKATINVNVFGTISLTRLLAPFMLKRGRGHFVVMSSAAGKTPAPGQAVYSASKFALNGYFHSLRSELFQRGIKVTVVCPGPIETSTSEKKSSSEKRVSSERCAELTIIAATHGLKEAWISRQISDKRFISQLDQLRREDYHLGPKIISYMVIDIPGGGTWTDERPVLAVMYLVQYMPTVGYWLMDKIGGKRVEVAAQKGNTYSLSLLFGKKKTG